MSLAIHPIADALEAARLGRSVGYNERRALVNALIPQQHVGQSVFLLTVRHLYAGGMTIADAFEHGLRTAVEKHPGFVPSYEPGLHELPD